MRFSEVFLKLGVGLVSWLVLYAHFLWLAVAGKIGCGPDGDEMFKVLLGLVPLTVLCAYLLRSSRTLGDVHSMLRWLSLPLFLLLPFGLIAVWDVGSGVNLGQSTICGAGTPSLWEQLWAPAQLLALLAATVAMLRMWWNKDSAGDADSEL